MIESRHFTSPVVRLARTLAGGSHKFIFNLYDRHMGTAVELESGNKESKAIHTIKKEIAFAVKDNAIRAALLGEFDPRINTKIEQLKKEKRLSQNEATVLGYSYFALLAQWTQEVAQDERIHLEAHQEEFLFALQVASIRLRHHFASQDR